MAPCLHVRAGGARLFSFLPVRDVETGGRQVVSFLSVKGRGDVMPLQLEMRLFMKGRISLEAEGVLKLVSSPSPPPPTPQTRPARG